MIRAKFGLDRPLAEQFFVYAGNVIAGTSARRSSTAPCDRRDRGPAARHAALISVALALGSLGGVALGTVAARRARRPADLLLRCVALLGHAAPSFWLAQVAILTLAIGTGFFPVQGMTDARRVSTGLAHVADVARHLALPALVLAAGELALTTRLVRTALLEALGTDYVRTARAKGFAERRVTGHALRNALLPVVTVIGGRIGMLCSGAVLVRRSSPGPASASSARRAAGPRLPGAARHLPAGLRLGGARQLLGRCLWLARSRILYE